MSEEYKPLGINPLEDTFKGPLPFNSMNAYFDLPETLREDFLIGLRFASAFAPTEAEYAARDRGEISEGFAESRFGMIADAYAASIDASFELYSTENNPQTTELRGILYKMVRTLTAEQIAQGVKGIETHQGTIPQGQK